MKTKDLGNRKIRIEFEDAHEAYLFNELYNFNVVKGAYAYKAGEFVEIDLKAYSTQYIVEPNKVIVEEEKPEPDPLFDFLID